MFPNNYKFSKYSKDTLKQFLKLVESSDKTVSSSQNAWKTFLPPDNDLINELNATNDDIIDLTGEILKLEDIPTVVDEITEKTSSLNVAKVDDILDTIIAHEGIISTETIALLKSLGPEELQILFSKLLAISNINISCKLGREILSGRNNENTVCILYFQAVLIPMAMQTFHDDIKELFLKYVEDIAAVLNDLSKSLVRSTSSNIIDLITSLNNDNKSKLLHDFVLNCTTLEVHNFAVISTLLSTQSHKESYKKIIDLLQAVSSTFNTDKNYGKLLLNLVQILGENVKNFETELVKIVGEHNSIWRSKIERTLQANLESSYSVNMTQNLLV